MDGQKLKKILAAEGVTASRLADHLGCSRQSVSYLFQAQSIKLEKLERIAELLGKKATDLLLPDSGSAQVEELKAQLKQKDKEIADLNARIDKLLAIIERQV